MGTTVLKLQPKRPVPAMRPPRKLRPRLRASLKTHQRQKQLKRKNVPMPSPPKNKANKAMDESTAHEKVTKEAANASEKRAKGAAAAKAQAEISNKEKAKKELDQKEKKQKEMQQKSAEKAKKEKDFKVKNTCTVTAYEHNDYKGRVTQTVKYCGGTATNFRFATKSWSRRRGFAASS